MSGFREFNDEGPGTYEWDYVLGGNTTGMFPDQTHYEVDGDVLLEVVYKHTGGHKYEPFYGSCWNISDVSSVHKGVSRDWFTFKQDGQLFKALINRELSTNDNLIVDLEEIK